MKPIACLTAAVFSLALLPGLILAQTTPADGSEAEADDLEPGVYIIFDASGSMRELLPDGTPKIEAARKVLQEFIKQDFEGKVVALRAYGHTHPNDCTDTHLVVPFSPPESARQPISQFAQNVDPKGRTPIGRSLRAALVDFGGRQGEIILISDGLETCGDDPCLLAKAWARSDVKIRIHVVGLGLNDVERAAMDCIADASGTEYIDAQSAEELAEGLSEIHGRMSGPSLAIRALNAEGEELRVVGRATSASGEETAVASHARYVLPPGPHRFKIGVETANGTLYQPVETDVDVLEHGRTLVEVVVPEPPSVKARFVVEGADRTGSQITALQDGEAVFSFRWLDQVYLDPGDYEFRARPNEENELSVRESFAAGDHKEIVFTMARTVKASIKMVAAGSGIDFRENYELWQNGEKVENVHWANGVETLPGVYDLHLTNPITPWVHRGLTLTAEEEQTFRIEVPCGHVTVIYRDSNGDRDSDERCWILRQDGDKWRSNKTQRAGEKIPLVPGTYRARGWDRRDKSYDEVEFTVSEGGDQEVVLRDKE